MLIILVWRQYIIVIVNHFHFIQSAGDFNPSSLTITINAGDMYGRANITLICDEEMEGLEVFKVSLVLTSNNSLVVIGGNTFTVVQIIDIIGKKMCNHYIK